MRLSTTFKPWHPSDQGIDPDTDEEETSPASTKPFAALAFKIATDPFVGRLTFFRVYSGVLQSGSYVLNATKINVDVSDVSFKCTLTAVNRHCYSGDIAAAVGLKDTTTGDSLTDEKTENHPWSQSTFQNQLSIDGLSRLKLTRTRWVCLQRWLKEDQHSALKQNVETVKQLSLVWVSFTLTSLIVICVVIRSWSECGSSSSILP